jgi:hypothetical protein
MLVKAAVQLRAAKPAALNISLVAPIIAQYSLPKLAVRAGGITVLSTFSAMAMRSVCMDIFDEEVDMDYLDGNESVASAADERAASAAGEREAEAPEDSEAETGEVSAAADDTDLLVTFRSKTQCFYDMKLVIIRDTILVTV